MTGNGHKAVDGSPAHDADGGVHRVVPRFDFAGTGTGTFEPHPGLDDFPGRFRRRMGERPGRILLVATSLGYLLTRLLRRR